MYRLLLSLSSSSPPLSSVQTVFPFLFFFFSSQPDLFSRIWCVSLCLRGHSVESTTFFLLIFMQVAPAESLRLRERPVNSLSMRHQLYSLETRPYVITPASASLSLLSTHMPIEFISLSTAVSTPLSLFRSQFTACRLLHPRFFFLSFAGSLSVSLCVPPLAHIKVLCYANTLLYHGPVLIYFSLLFFFLSLSPLGNLLSQQ